MDLLLLSHIIFLCNSGIIPSENGIFSHQNRMKVLDFVRYDFKCLIFERFDHKCSIFSHKIDIGLSLIANIYVPFE